MSDAPLVTIHIPGPLRQYCEGASRIAVTAPTIAALLEDLNQNHSALYRNLCDETGKIRRHLNVFVNADHIRDLGGLQTALRPGDVVTFLPAVSGG